MSSERSLRNLALTALYPMPVHRSLDVRHPSFSRHAIMSPFRSSSV